MQAPLAGLVDSWRDFPFPHERWVVGHAARAFALAGLARRRPLLAVVPSERDAEEIAEDLSLFTSRVALLPAWETLPFEHVSPNVSTMAARARARRRLRVGEAGDVVVASVRAAVQRLSPSSPDPIELSRGEEHSLPDLARSLADLGYERTDRVESRGEFAIRGGILDLFPADGDEAVRVDFWGDEIQDLRMLSIVTQRSLDPIDRVSAFPAREFRPDPDVREGAGLLARSDLWAAATWDRLEQGQQFPGMEAWMPWLAPPRSVLDEVGERWQVVVLDPDRAADRGRELVEEEADLAAALAPTWGQGAPTAGEHPALYLDFSRSIAGRRVLQIPAVPAGPDDAVLPIAMFDAVPGDAASVAAGLRKLIATDVQVVVAMDGAGPADRVARLLGEEGLAIARSAEAGARGSVIIERGIHRGFVLPELALAVLGEQEIAGRRRAHRTSRARVGEGSAIYRDLEIGDYVVHHRHGIGRFEGLTTTAMAGVERDYLVVAYAGEDRLYVPTDQLAAVKRYTGGEAPRLSRMGGRDWQDVKDRVRRAAVVVAQEVVRLHRARAAASGHVFPPDTPWQREMEASFPYEETPDQLTAIDAVKADMQSGEPMDRLVFGDVGFGKTEVAVRAAFKAATDGAQVAVLCPTTLLAQQHHQTFSERYASYPIQVEMLSRFLSPRQQKSVIDRVATGEVDVVIGTHRLLSDDLRWKNLGLVVVDEEQRFGVSAKDQLKRLRVGVDVLTLTATPIPRTLEMALTGIRDVSHIRTAPEDRHPILTYVGPYDTSTVAAAIRREMLREGQVFYVHNRIGSIEQAVAKLRGLVPDARLGVAHGRMSEGQLEQVMIDFWNRQFDVLVATTIIESGLDLPQVNTLIVERADLLGLAQLYQLRGRVGRSSQRAYAYLFHPVEQSLTEEAYRRLEAVGEAADLGSGFRLALKDLEIRGAGSILGEVQSGHIAAVGFDLYADLVAEAVDAIEGREPPRAPDNEIRIELPVGAHLPDDYVPDQAQRLEAYRRLALATTQTEVDDVAAEWDDRFGPPPEAARTLIQVARLRVEALRIGLTEIIKLRDEVRLAPVDLSAAQEVRLQRLAKRAVLRAQEGVLFLPSPVDLVTGLLDFLVKMWPGEPDAR
ncbi:MAG TPA: transcription-repair coupling factor [Acidimicrobiia bacterium]